MRAAAVRSGAYPVYFVHLVVVLALMLTLPYTKLAHAVYRVMALAGRNAPIRARRRARPGPPGQERAGEQEGPGRRHRPGAGQRAGAWPSPAELLAMTHAELSHYRRRPPGRLLRLAEEPTALRRKVLPQYETAGG